MKLISKTLLITIVALLVLGGAGYWFIQDLSNQEGEEIAAAAEEIEKQAGSKVAAETEEPEHIGMDETQVQIYLHQMTHQKIVADEKRGAVEMSAENIEDMLTIVRTNEGAFEHSKFYEETLTAWEQGDFSNAVSVHNTIWDWHNGTVGRATDLMTEEQEAEYVEKHFK